MKKKELMAKAAFLEKVGYLLDGGLPLLKSLELLAAETTDGRTKKAIQHMVKYITDMHTPDGKPKSEFDFTLALDPDYFSAAEIQMLVVGAKGGRLDRAFLLIVPSLDRELSYQSTGR